MTPDALVWQSSAHHLIGHHADTLMWQSSISIPTRAATDNVQKFSFAESQESLAQSINMCEFTLEVRPAGREICPCPAYLMEVSGAISTVSSQAHTSIVSSHAYTGIVSSHAQTSIVSSHAHNSIVSSHEHTGIVSSHAHTSIVSSHAHTSP